jgi:GrpB-like predicted nucleotidyltransferase (UPF0157 family)
VTERDPQVERAIREEVAIVPYDPGWPAQFLDEKAHLEAHLPRDLLGRIEHFGSTAVPGLAAKPIIDMLVEVSDLAAARDRIVPILRDQSYQYFWRPTQGDDGEPFYCWFIKRGPRGERTHHIHMVEPSFTGHWERLAFRDFLRREPEVAREYEKLKRSLAVLHPNDRVSYTEGKRGFIEKVMASLTKGSAPSEHGG